ncbi:MAG: carboxymuconolactone decarboxylase family protein [bacterium]|nr:carboxymuconolactone decarboxylase family protein [bacterium]
MSRFILPLMMVTFLVFGLGLGLGRAGSDEERAHRVRPLSADEWSPEVRRLLGGTHARLAVLEGAESSPKTLNILRTIAHHPNLLGPFLGFATALAQEGALTRRDSELLALRASWNCQSEFEWGHHVVFARTAGLTDEEIARIPDGPEASGWSPDDRVLLLAADQLHARQQIGDDLWNRLALRFSDTQLVEIPFVVGQYTMLSMVANSTGVELEAGHDRLPLRD